MPVWVPLRVALAMASAPWREVTSAGALIDGCRVPAGYNVGMGTYSIQRNKTYVPQQSTFTPERWLVDSAATRTREILIVPALSWLPSASDRGAN